jgi:hypothetical protein
MTLERTQSVWSSNRFWLSRGGTGLAHVLDVSRIVAKETLQEIQSY